jgi:hypothetical protein
MATVPQWQAGTTYVPGACVVPTYSAPPALQQPGNPGFETGDFTDWHQSGAGTWSIANSPVFSGSHSAKITGTGGGTAALYNTLLSPCTPGQVITATAQLVIDNVGGTDDTSSTLMILWYGSSGYLSSSSGSPVQGAGGSWEGISCTGTAPSGATQCAIGVQCNTGTTASIVNFDQFSWSGAAAGPPAGLIYQATQAAPGKSGATEPTWPGNTTTPVTDNQVTWEGILATQLVWTAVPINISGATQPTWPTTPGGTVNDNGIIWVAFAFNIQDVNCPNGPIVSIAASKIYCANDDIINYSATANPLDWTSADNAGYLPFGLQTYGSNPAAAMNLYRSNLCIFSAEGFQMWQVNEDPSVTALIDALPIATTWEQAMCPVANDLLFLSSEGVRSLGIAATGVSLEAGDVGMPIDPIVQPFIAAAKADGTPVLSTYFPAAGQYWLAFPDSSLTDPTTVFIATINQLNTPPKWSRYVFPFRIDNFTINGDYLYIRSGNDVLRYDPTAVDDYQDDPDNRQVGFDGWAQWLWLDDETPGVLKNWDGCDITCQSGQPYVQFFYDQNNLNTGTPAYNVPTDSMTGQKIPIQIFSPSCSLRVGFAPGTPWKLMMANLYIDAAEPFS